MYNNKNKNLNIIISNNSSVGLKNSYKNKLKNPKFMKIIESHQF